MKNLKIIDVGNKYGNMNLNINFYPSHFSKKDMIESFNIRRELMGLDYGFDGKSMYMADQVKENGSYFEINEDYVDAFPNGWTYIKEDILVMADGVRRVAIGYPAADCPVVMGYDQINRVVAVGHCSSRLIDKMLPKSIIDSLYYSYGSKDSNIKVYVSASADKDSYLYRDYPKWAKDQKVWDGLIKEDENGLYHIDLKGAVKRQLLERNIDEENICISKIDTVTNSNFFSNHSEKQGNMEKAGRNFPCAFFPDQKVLIKKRTR